jgi:putative ABC transport system ATP-binding protein
MSPLIQLLQYISAKYRKRLDEPTGNFDEKNSRAILKIIRDLHEKGATVIMVTHDNEIASVSQRIIKISDGMSVEQNLG